MWSKLSLGVLGECAHTNLKLCPDHHHLPQLILEDIKKRLRREVANGHLQKIR